MDLANNIVPPNKPAEAVTIRARRTDTRPAPIAIDQHSSSAALQAIASIEAAKGIAVLLIGFGLLSLLHKDAQGEAEHLVVFLHLDPDRSISQAIVRAASRLTDGRLWAYAATCAMYTIVRFTEAYGLWNRRVWAEWFALLSGALYLPWEILQVIDRSTRLRWALLLINLAVVLYMAYIRLKACRQPDCKQIDETSI